MKSEAIVRFKRALRRLGTIQRFANMCGIKMDPMEYDIMRLNIVQFQLKKQAELRSQEQEEKGKDVITKELMRKKYLTDFEKTCAMIDIGSFFKGDYLDEVKMVQLILTEIQKKNKSHLKKLAKFFEKNKD